MNKKFLSVVLFGALMAGSSVTFTGCIDNDEPAGIEELRGAKAELLRAKAVVEQAHAANVLAQAEYNKALAAHEQANADYRQAEVEYQKLMNDLQAAQNEQEKALIEERIAAAQNRMEEAAKKHEAVMLELDTQLELAKRNYELVLQQITIAKELASDKATVSITYLENEVKKLYADLYGGTYQEINYSLTTDDKGYVTISETPGDKITVTVEKSLAGKLRAAEEKLYNATMDKSEGGEDGKQWIPTLKLKVEEKEVALAAEKEVLRKLEEFMKSDIATTDWTSQITALEDSIKVLDSAIKAKNIEIAEAKNSEKYLAADQDLNGVKNNKGEIVKDGAKQVLNKAKKALEKAKADDDNKFSYEKVDYSKDVTGGMKAAIEAGMKANDKNVDLKLELAEAKDWKFGAEEDVTWGGENLASELAEAEEFYKELIENVENAYNDPNTVAYNKANLASAEKELEKKAEDLEEAKANWQHAVNAMNGTPDEVPTTGLEEGAKAFNAAWDSYKAAVDAYNKAFDAAFVVEKNKVVLEKVQQKATKPEVYLTESEVEGSRDHFAPDNNFTTTWNDQLTKDASTLKVLIAKYCTEFTNAAGKKVTAEALAGQIYNYLAGKASSEFDKDKTAVAEAVTKARTIADKDGKLAEAVIKAITAITDSEKGAIKVLEKSIADYTDLANKTYAMALTEEAVEAQKVKVLAGIEKDGEFTMEFPKLPDTDGKFAVKSTKVEAAEITAAAEVEFNQELAEAALIVQSKNVWGEFDEPRMVEPTIEEIRKAATEDAVAYKWVKASDKVQKCKDVISAEEDLKAFAEVIEKDFTDFKADFTKQYNDAFGELITAIDDAQKDFDAKKDALDAIHNEIIKPIEVEQAKLMAQKKATTAVKQAIIASVNAMLGSTTPDDTESFVAEMNKQILDQKKAVAKAERNLKVAQNALQEAEEGLYDDVADAEIELKIAQANFDAANAEYQTALDNLAKAMEVIANSVE